MESFFSEMSSIGGQCALLLCCQRWHSTAKPQLIKEEPRSSALTTELKILTPIASPSPCPPPQTQHPSSHYRASSHSMLCQILSNLESPNEPSMAAPVTYLEYSVWFGTILFPSNYLFLPKNRPFPISLWVCFRTKDYLSYSQLHPGTWHAGDRCSIDVIWMNVHWVTSQALAWDTPWSILTLISAVTQASISSYLKSQK